MGVALARSDRTDRIDDLEGSLDFAKRQFEYAKQHELNCERGREESALLQAARVIQQIGAEKLMIDPEVA